MLNKANDSPVTTVFVYGYGIGNRPFYKEARTKKLDSARWSLLMNTPVSCGQRLLLMDGREQNPIEAEIVNTRSLADHMFEVEVAVTR